MRFGPKGEALLPVLLAVRQWGEDWGMGSQEIVLADLRNGKPVRRICVQSHDGRPLALHELMWIDQATGAELRREPADMKKAAG